MSGTEEDSLVVKAVHREPDASPDAIDEALASATARLAKQLGF